MAMIIWTYTFEDGTKIERSNISLPGQELITLSNTLSDQELMALTDIHGKVTIGCKRVN